LMLPKKNVTEDDVKATEASLAESYARFKQALKDIPSEAVRPMTDAVSEHPYATVAVAAGAGFLAFKLLDVLIPRTKVITREVSVQPEIEVKEVKRKEGRSLASRLLSEAVTFAMPYIKAYMQVEISKLLSRPEEGEAVPAGPEKKAE
jgi:hypothetical protein